MVGSDVLVRLNERVRQMEQEIEGLRTELQRIRDKYLPAAKQGEE